jgi:tetratricopeptide (TPR) repeat protein
MKGKKETFVAAGALAALLLACCNASFGQQPTQQGQQGQQQGQQQPPAGQQQDKSKTQELTLDAPAPPVNAEEDAAFKAFQAVSNDPKKRAELGEGFLQKYPQSRYATVVYSALTIAYLQTGQVEKMEQAGEKEIELNPNDGQTLAILGQTIPRAMNANTPDPAKQLTKAEQYSKRALEIVPTMQKPDGLTDEQFTSAKNQTMAMAHSGLGLVYVRRSKFADAIPELEQSVKMDPQPDPVNFYLLGLANQKESHFTDAEAAYNKCAAIASSMQQACKNGAEQAKKDSATQLSAPK